MKHLTKRELVDRDQVEQDGPLIVTLSADLGPYDVYHVSAELDGVTVYAGSFDTLREARRHFRHIRALVIAQGSN